jgi:hypothetical protein
MVDTPNAAEVAARAGIDLALIDDNLRLTHTERALQHQAALEFALEIERAGIALRERPAETSATAG